MPGIELSTKNKGFVTKHFNFSDGMRDDFILQYNEKFHLDLSQTRINFKLNYVNI
jgi:hypothetical protein